MSARQDAKPVRGMGVKLLNRRVEGHLCRDGSVSWKFKNLQPDKTINTVRVRLTPEAMEAMFAIYFKLAAAGRGKDENE